MISPPGHAVFHSSIDIIDFPRQAHLDCHAAGRCHRAKPINYAALMGTGDL